MLYSLLSQVVLDNVKTLTFRTNKKGNPLEALYLSRSSSDESCSGVCNLLHPPYSWLVRQCFLHLHLSTVRPYMLGWDALAVDALVLFPTVPACWLGAPSVSGTHRPVSFSWMLPSHSALVAPITDVGHMLVLVGV